MIRPNKILIILSFVVLTFFIRNFNGITGLDHASQTAYQECKFQNVNHTKGRISEERFQAATKQIKNMPVFIAFNGPLQGLLSSNANSYILPSNFILPQAIHQPSEDDSPEVMENKLAFLFNNAPGGTILGTWRVRNNSNVKLAEVLRGEAVLTYDPEIGENHQGRTTANNDENRGLDFVQKMMNHIIVPLRTPVQKGNQENIIIPDGYYGDKTLQTLQALIEGGNQTHWW